MLVGSYDLSLVLISLAVAVLASYTALNVAGRVVAAKGTATGLWIAGGAVSMGTGIWAMHFIGMLAFRLPIPLGYDLTLTLLSLAIAMLASGFALWLVSQESMPLWHWLLGSLTMAVGIASMHYIGMHALLMQPGIQYDFLLVALSLVFAFAASASSLWIAFRLRRGVRRVRLARILAAAMLGGAIIGMHYIGMAAANFPLGSYCSATTEGVDSGWLASLVSVVSLSLLVIALLTAVLDARLEAHTAVLHHSLAEATRLALHDALTKLPNRLLLEDRIEQSIRRVNRHGGCFALMFMDLDGFKPINDAYGHQVGDSLLRQVARRLREHLRAEDTLARVGGDEFVLLTELRDLGDAMAVAEYIGELLSRPFRVGRHRLQVSTSVGIALYPRDGNTRQELLRNADAAMYHAKATGKDGYSFFEADMLSHGRDKPRPP